MRRCALVMLVACGAAPPAPATPVASDAVLAVHPAEAIAELGDATYVFGGGQLHIVRGGVAIVTVPLATTSRVSAATIRALDGDGRWVVAAVADKLWRVSAAGELESIGDRLGLGAAVIRSVASAGATFAIELADGVPVSTDGVHLARYPIDGALTSASPAALLRARRSPGLQVLAVARGRLAIGTDRAVELWDLARGSREVFASGRPLSVQFLDADTATPRLVVATADGVFVAHDHALHRIATPRGELAVATSGSHVWLADAHALYLVDGDRLVRTTAAVQPGATLAPAAAGVWLVADSTVTRFSLAAAAGDPRWQASIAPIFARVCAHCHLPGGSAGLDLSTPGAWQLDRAELARRVLVTRTMPPAGSELTDAERAALTTWLDAAP